MPTETTLADTFAERIVSDVFEGNKSPDDLAGYLDPNFRKCVAPISVDAKDESQDSHFVPVTWYVFSDMSFALYNGGDSHTSAVNESGGYGVPLVGMVDGPHLQV